MHGERELSISIAYCDDVPMQRELIAELLDDFATEYHYAIDVHGFATPVELLEAVKANGPYDIYLLDLIMPEMSGMDLARKLRGLGDDNHIIFVSATTDYLLESYDVRTFFYLTKPVGSAKFARVLVDAISSIEQKKSNKITIATGTGLHRVAVSDITYVSVVERTLQYHTVGGETIESKKIRGSFKEAVDFLLDDHGFILCGSSMVINPEQVRSFAGEEIELKNKVVIYPPKRVLHEVREAIEAFWNN